MIHSMSNANTAKQITLTLNRTDSEAYRAGESFPREFAMDKASRMASRLASRVIVETSDGQILAVILPSN
jgi:hypothetical protein